MRNKIKMTLLIFLAFLLQACPVKVICECQSNPPVQQNSDNSDLASDENKNENLEGIL
jgi:hypothetical protein